ncbi:hypothetical protein P153DRAFT_390382 [Dothidotthia symphoricarpi CBS 119687]|uniref:Rhodopsin domain-containing protein n=1 Tax=Dothidotthia symphoricarpi CBS 119687 TaxID=1392245 RepID=A0A6A6A0W3_9PLEO|nr:uncharacterized protein P153DRAFT_390382 [Dothidotthia symphoricarpi CBS 119687]KAF2124348.1 hypothetical protein P153DRAFT_390382 [Dothidotthia symphoricarpi CBS 119687]
MAPTHDSKFLPEIWTSYAIGTVWLLLRFAVRVRIAGIRGLRLDDGFAFVALGCWTYTIVTTHITYSSGTNTDFTESEVAKFSEQKFSEVVYGTKMFLASCYIYIALVFSLKGIVIVLYQRLAIGAWQKFILKATTYFCIMGYISVTAALTFDCQPISRRWSLPADPSGSCRSSPRVLITLSCINALSDIWLLCIPVPLLWTLNIPLQKRIGVFFLLASGLFVLAACITRVSLTVVPNISIFIIARWGIREFTIAIIAVNSAALRPLFRRSFWGKPDPAGHAHRHANNYLFPTIQHARRRGSRYRIHDDVLNSTSAGASTVDNFNYDEHGRQEEYVFEDPDYRVPNPLHTAQNVARRSGLRDSFRSLGRSWNESRYQSEARTRPVSEGGNSSVTTHDNDLEKGGKSNDTIMGSESGCTSRSTHTSIGEEEEKPLETILPGS